MRPALSSFVRGRLDQVFLRQHRVVKTLFLTVLQELLDGVHDFISAGAAADVLEQGVEMFRGAIANTVDQPVQRLLVRPGLVEGALKSGAASHVEGEVNNAFSAHGLA